MIVLGFPAFLQVFLDFKALSVLRHSNRRRFCFNFLLNIQIGPSVCLNLKEILQYYNTNKLPESANADLRPAGIITRAEREKTTSRSLKSYEHWLWTSLCQMLHEMTLTRLALLCLDPLSHETPFLDFMPPVSGHWAVWRWQLPQSASKRLSGSSLW